MSKHLKKEEFQQAAVQAWIKKGGKGTVEAATGSGKNFVSFLAIQSVVDPGDERPILLLAETTNREDTYFEDLAKYEEIYKVDLKNAHNWEFACYQSAYKWEGRDYKMVIADEIHDSLTIKYSEFYFNNNFDKIIGLSATVDRQAKIDSSDPECITTKGDLLKEIAPVCFTYNMDSARKEGVLPPLNLYVINHQLDSTKKTIKGGSQRSGYFMQTEAAAYSYRENKFLSSLRLPENVKKYAIRTAVQARSSLMYELPSKTEAVKKLVDTLSSKFRTIVFGNSLPELHKICPDSVVASKDSENKVQKEETNKEIIRRFQEEETNLIGSFKKMKQGENLKNLDMVVLHSYYSKDKDYIQRIGRLRFRDNFIATAVVFRTQGTVEQKWFKAMTESLDISNALYFDGVDHFLQFVKNNNFQITVPQFASVN